MPIQRRLNYRKYICEKIAGKEIREKIQRQMDYHAYSCQ